ncbi:hypothetical protein A3H04_00085 [Candidatus Giovannonibacteria bacterium RIFCSPLOWO2_12_FULL_43_11c]|uniref:Peptidase S51 n=1 Tax=Candidatus Giovannonibacteria bacterium RIFCSPHIGHO2_12_FULL_43_15 TaxID=1798341 RepID=A0A1F5WQV8_9BACT|nr:MAG: hypothetical protein A2739_01875 [Candidatus Giovannonibacteria bacterium RIFCSPHIGHO2_01_FULL_43_100]OGF67824.1 MAG: hypothetical protein A3B97_00905 [Candidatus Giovannonibacteria bacterium RIFCSPHIGHO2_02_FULL_43_32]OGF77984.1 MAG: hypothetical protein A3F23_03260 [Candidatus Giovannonibacteria bacterium RIFCSPHIGHO2_12_FULL_43_15]OGF79505.1 MAG: hypothetical protein A3A15_02125 [Candidatus Giovannonibacteria bacterium RIFCSPLOWO2_01_FULL_43_60]OGF91391.1 MAG: hypothetical protein A3
MKFLLTSGGITNKSIAKALRELVGKKAKDIRIAFIPTAANIANDDGGNKIWLIKDLYNLLKQGYKSIDIVDISALPKENWRGRLEAADVLFFGGGNTFYLRYWLKKSGFWKLLPKLLRTRVYAGISAGSMIASKNLALSQSRRLYYEKRNYCGDGGEDGLGFFDFHFRPHLNSPHFPKVRREFLKKIAKEFTQPVYALDDKSALKISGNKIEIISEGKYLVLNK